MASKKNLKEVRFKSKLREFIPELSDEELEGMSNQKSDSSDVLNHDAPKNLELETNGHQESNEDDHDRVVKEAEDRLTQLKKLGLKSNNRIRRLIKKIKKNNGTNFEEVESHVRSVSWWNKWILKSKILPNLAIRATIDTYLNFSSSSKIGSDKNKLKKELKLKAKIKKDIAKLFERHSELYKLPVKKRNALLEQFCKEINRLQDPSKYNAVLAKYVVEEKVKGIQANNESIRSIWHFIPESSEKEDFLLRLTESIAYKIEELDGRLKQGKHLHFKSRWIIRKLKSDTTKLDGLAGGARAAALAKFNTQLDNHFGQYQRPSDIVSEAEVAHYNTIKEELFNDLKGRNPEEIIPFVATKMDKAKPIKDAITKKLEHDYDGVSEHDLNEILQIAYREFENYKGVDVKNPNESVNYYLDFADWVLREPACKSILAACQKFCDAPSTLTDLSKLTTAIATTSEGAQRKDFVSKVPAKPKRVKLQ